MIIVDAVAATSEPGATVIAWLMSNGIQCVALVFAAVACYFMGKLVSHEQATSKAATRELIDILKLQPAAIAKLENAITGLSHELGAVRRGHDELRARVDTHGARLDDHDNRIRVYEYSAPAPAPAPKQRKIAVAAAAVTS